MFHDPTATSLIVDWRWAIVTKCAPIVNRSAVNKFPLGLEAEFRLLASTIIAIWIIAMAKHLTSCSTVMLQRHLRRANRLLTSFQYAATRCQLLRLPGMVWISDDPLLGIQGQWWEVRHLISRFDNKEYRGYDPLWMMTTHFLNLHFLLMTLGCFLIVIRNADCAISQNLLKIRRRLLRTSPEEKYQIVLYVASLCFLCRLLLRLDHAGEYEGMFIANSNQTLDCRCGGPSV